MNKQSEKKNNEFIENWKIKVGNHYKELKQNVDSIKGYRAKKDFLKKYPKSEAALMLQYGKQGTKLFEEKIKKAIEDDAESKKKSFIKRVEAKIGSITETNELKIGVDGSINGVIKGENGKAKVETIMAAGEIQKPHFRVLVKKI